MDKDAQLFNSPRAVTSSIERTMGGRLKLAVSINISFGGIFTGLNDSVGGPSTIAIVQHRGFHSVV